MKQCFKCKVIKSKDEFYKNKTAPDGLYTYCKTCHDVITKNYWGKNKKLFSSLGKRRYSKKRKFLTDYKRKLKCQACGEGDPVCLVFRHRNPKDKDFYIGCSVWGYGVETIMKEIAKCDVLCANCHAKLHYDLKKK